MRRGFTLVELLIVMTIVTITATIVLIGLSPLEQFTKARDANRTATITQLGRAIKSYAVVSGSYPAEGSSWITTLYAAGELKAIPSDNTYANPDLDCSTGINSGINQAGYCYDASGPLNNEPPFIVYAALESRKFTNEAQPGETTWQVYSSLGNSGVYHFPSEPGPDLSPAPTPTPTTPESPTNTPPPPTPTPTSPPTPTPTPTPTPPSGPTVVLNSATGQSCDTVCADSGFSSCIDIGIDSGGTNNLYYSKANCGTSNGTCSTPLGAGSVSCGTPLHQIRWTNCLCQ